MVITGATSGLGLQAARELSRLGANTCIVGRDADRLEAARCRIDSGDGPPVVTEQAELSDLDEVDRLADRLFDRFDHIDVLVHNAGALLHRRQTSPQGIEVTLAVHLLAPYVLTERLLPLLTSHAASRVITMTSGGMYSQRFNLDKLVAPRGRYRGTVAYARAKRAQVVLTHEWQRRYGPKEIDFYVTHPGWADTPGLSAGLPLFAKMLRPALRPPRDGVDTGVWLATASEGPTSGGQLWFDRRPRSEYHVPWTWTPPRRRVAEGQALWEWCRDRVTSPR